jgi:hypothetical protein
MGRKVLWYREESIEEKEKDLSEYGHAKDWI